MRASLAALALLAGPAAAQEAPASAIGWLSESLRAPATAPAERPPEPDATALSETAIATSTLGATRRDAVGLIAAEATGLPRDAVAGSRPETLARALDDLPRDGLPVLQALVSALLLAELDPPRAAADPDAWFLVRVDALLGRGAVAQAQALMERAGALDAPTFRRWFDAALLTGDDARACEEMTRRPGIAPALPARVFCLSRTDDWAAAALTLDTGRALGAVTQAEDALLGRFLDPELFEDEPPAIPPRPMTPLAFRLLDGIGEPPGTRDLPIAFAVADLRPEIGWKAQIEAAERLVRRGALDPNRLMALYTERRPSASGGVWERADAVQDLERALTDRDAEAARAALVRFEAETAPLRLFGPLAEAFGERAISLLPEDPVAQALAMMSSDPRRLAEAHGAALDPVVRAIATGAPVPPPDGTAPRVATDAARAGFAAQPSEGMADLLASDRAGEALIAAARALGDAREGRAGGVTDAIATLRALGLEDLARRATLQLWYLG